MWRPRPGTDKKPTEKRSDKGKKLHHLDEVTLEDTPKNEEEFLAKGYVKEREYYFAKTDDGHKTSEESESDKTPEDKMTMFLGGPITTEEFDYSPV